MVSQDSIPKEIQVPKETDTYFTKKVLWEILQKFEVMPEALRPFALA